MSFVAEHFKELDFFSSNFNLTIMSFCTQGLPGVAESTLEKVKKTSSWRSVTVRAIKSLGESALARPSTNVCNGPPLPEGQG